MLCCAFRVIVFRESGGPSSRDFFVAEMTLLATVCSMLSTLSFHLFILSWLGVTQYAGNIERPQVQQQQAKPQAVVHMKQE